MYKNPLVIKYKILRLVLHCRELGYSVNYHICNYNIYNKSFLKKCLNHKKKKKNFHLLKTTTKLRCQNH